MTENARKELIAGLTEAAEKDSRTERIRVPWKSGTILCPVIELSVDVPLLNPGSHRIKAQLLSHPERQIVEQDPWSSRAQEIIAELLAATEGFEELQIDLQDKGQTDPGVITRTGVLVNANTRLVALRHNNARYVRVAVLPEGVTQRDISEVELRLQVKKDLKQEYTFTNKLLFIEEMMTEYGYTPDQIAVDLGYTPTATDKKLLDKAIKEVHKDIRLLTLIRETIDLSNKRLRLVDFDDKRQALSEIDEQFEQLKNKDLAAAIRMRHMRLVGMLVGVGYRELREVDAKFLQDHLLPGLEEGQLGDHIASIIGADGNGGARQASSTDSDLDLLGDPINPPSGSTQSDPKALLELIAQTHGDDYVQLPSKSGKPVEISREVLIDEMRAAIEDAAHEIRDAVKKGNRLEAPARFLAEALRKLENARDSYQDARTDPKFDHNRFDERLKEIERMVEALRMEFDRTPKVTA
jgi:hypothetical protein